jgi:rare lipoprotein A
LKQNHATTHSCVVKRVALTAALAALFVAGQGVTPSQAHSPYGFARIAPRTAYPDRRHARLAYADRRHARGPHVARTAPSGGFSEGAGLASVYGGGRTGNGGPMNSGAMTAAHRTLPFGTQVTVVNQRNGLSAVVRINDRGPFVRGRVIDLSPAAARVLGISGLAPVSLRVRDQPP